MVARTQRRTKSAEPPALTPEAGWQQLEQLARRQLGMSAEAFLHALQTGEFAVQPVEQHAPAAPPQKPANGTPNTVVAAEATAEGSPRRRRKPPEVRELTREEGRALFDRTAREFLGISGDEFLRRWDAGEIKNPDTPEVMPVFMSMPFVRDCP